VERTQGLESEYWFWFYRGVSNISYILLGTTAPSAIYYMYPSFLHQARIHFPAHNFSSAMGSRAACHELGLAKKKSICPIPPKSQSG